KKKLVAPLQQPFAEALARHVAAGRLPPGVGCLRVKKKPHLFFLTDVGVTVPPAQPPAAPKPPQPATATPPDFARLFEQAFDRLDRERGSHNLVSLVALRRALPVGRAAFDAELQRLRRAGRYSRSAA